MLLVLHNCASYAIRFHDSVRICFVLGLLIAYGTHGGAQERARDLGVPLTARPVR